MKIELGPFEGGMGVVLDSKRGAVKITINELPGCDGRELELIITDSEKKELIDALKIL